MNLAKHIKSEAYVLERVLPKHGESTYLHLSDLLMAMKDVATETPLKILDYGCGGSPYKSLFPKADYSRADHLQKEGEHLDYILGSDSMVKEKDQAFDFILSTQVLEHVGNPANYLKECFRLLKSGGNLFLTTHGSYPDHGCPYDYYRWTADGLVRAIEAEGFNIIYIKKLTTGPRAFIQNCDTMINDLRAPRRTLFGFLLYGVRNFYRLLRPWIHRMCDLHFAAHRVASESLDKHATYIVVACLAQKK